MADSPNDPAKPLANQRWLTITRVMLMSVVQITFVTSAIKTYYSTSREKGDVRVLLNQALLFIPCLILMGICTTALPDLYYTRQQGRAASAVDALRKINSAQASYAGTYPQGFSPTLAAMGPPPGGTARSASAAGLIASDLASGAKSEYTFRYTPEAPGAAGKTTTYTLTAAPSQPECTRWKRFFTDQTGTIHATSENRPAKVNDPGIEHLLAELNATQTVFPGTRLTLVFKIGSS